MDHLPSSARSSTDLLTVIAVGVLGATVATISHETLGHSIGCISGGGNVTLLTSIWFRCSKWSLFAEVGGPLGNLILGSLAVLLLRAVNPGPIARLFLLIVGALNLFWFTAQLAFESVTNRHDDWYTVFHLGSPAIMRGIGTFIGIGGYFFVARVLAMVVRTEGTISGRDIRLAYLAAVISAGIAGLLWVPEPFRSALEELLTLGVSPIALLRISKLHHHEQTNVSVLKRSWSWIVVSAALYTLFLFVQARGLGSLASMKL